MSKLGLEGISVVWWFTLIFIICRVYASKWLRRVLLFHFLLIVGIKGEKGSLAHDKTLFGRRFCRLVIYANLHNLPCICVKMAPTGTFFHFLLIVGIKGEKGSLAHDKTLFGRRFCCLVIYANHHNLPCICIEIAPTGTFFTFLLVAGNKVEKGSLEHVKTWFGRRFYVSVVWWYTLIFTICRVYASKWLRRVPFFTFLVGLGIKVKKKVGTCQNLAWKAFLLFGDLC